MNTQKLNRKTKMENREMNNQLQIELKEDVAQGTYANLAVITHSSSEFIVDFVRVMPGMPKASVKSRIVLAPEHAKRLLRALEENIGKYERTFGSIRLLDVAFFLVALCRIQTGEEDAMLAEFTGVSDDVFQNPLL